MLTITRREGEGFWIGDSYVVIGRIRRCDVRVSIRADASVRIMRGELEKGRPCPGDLDVRVEDKVYREVMEF